MLGEKKKKKKVSLNGREVCRAACGVGFGDWQSFVVLWSVAPDKFLWAIHTKILCVPVNYLVSDYDQEERSQIFSF